MDGLKFRVRLASLVTEEKGMTATPMILSLPNTDLCLATTCISAKSQFCRVLWLERKQEGKEGGREFCDFSINVLK